MTTLDTSCLIAILLNEPAKAKLITLTRGQTLIAPQFLHWEVPNAFSAMFKRNPPRLELSEAKKALDIYSSIPIRFVELDLNRAIEIAHSLNIYAYDAFMLTVSERYNAPLLTLDKKCRDAARALKVPVVEV